MTYKDACELVKNLQTVFDIVRFVDVSMTTQYQPGTKGKLEPGKYQCYAVWNKAGRCENCVSARAFAQKTRLTKYEFIGNDVYYVVAKYVEIDDTPYVLEMVSNVTDHVLFGAVGKEHLIEAINLHNEKLYKDALTGAYNREYYEEQLQALKHANAIAMVDVDCFKSINDTYGHQAGDAALHMVVEQLIKNVRGTDAVIRYGGDEFLIVFRNMMPGVLPDKLEILRGAIEKARVDRFPNLHVTVSIGGCFTEDADIDCVRLADQRMYKAKEKKNTVCCG